MSDDRTSDLPEGASSRERPKYGGGLSGALHEAGEAVKDTLDENQAHSEAGTPENAQGEELSSVMKADAHVTDRERP